MSVPMQKDKLCVDASKALLNRIAIVEVCDARDAL